MERHLTTPAPGDLNALMSLTPPGMAWIAGTGPSGEMCRTCTHWRRGKRPSYDVPSPRSRKDVEHTGELRPQSCSMYSKLMLRGALEVTGARVPADASACRHFKPLPKGVVAAPLRHADRERLRQEAKEADRAAVAANKAAAKLRRAAA